MDDSSRLICMDCRAEFLTRDCFSEHRLSCRGGGSSQSYSTDPQESPSVDTDPQTFLGPFLIQSILADVDAATRRKKLAYELAMRAAMETRRHNESLSRIRQQQDSLHAMEVEARGRLRSAIESEANSKDDRFIYRMRMEHASKSMKLFVRQEQRTCTALHRAITEQAAAMAKLLEAMGVERSTFNYAVSLFSSQAGNTTQPAAPEEQAKGFSEE